MVKNLRLLREEKGLSQQALAEMLNISQQAVFKYEKSSNEPDISTLIKLADIFEVTVDYLIGNTDIREKVAKSSAVLLTEEEIEHIKRWRAVSANIKQSIENLITEIQENKK